MQAIVWISGASTGTGVVRRPRRARELGLPSSPGPGLRCRRRGPRRPPHPVVMTSGAASSVYPGWASYGAGKAAVDQWVRAVGVEQEERGGVHFMAVGPGTVDTGMQAKPRETPEEQLPKRKKFVDLHDEGKLSDPHDVARRLWGLLDAGLDNGTVSDLRKLVEADAV